MGHWQRLNTTSESARETFDVTPSDSEEQCGRWCYVGSAGDVTIHAEYDAKPRTFFNVPAGTTLGPIRYTRVLASGTTATGIVGLR